MIIFRFFVLAAALLALVPAASSASSSTVVVAEVYAAGGNAGASYASDYVELVNRGATAVDVTGWSVQYASAASSSWSATPIAGTIPAGGHYLVALADGTTGAALPAADATGTTNLAATGGKVALVGDATPLTCGLTAGSCAASVRDLVGYGTATDYEGSAAAPALSATTAAVRAAGGCTDTDNNVADFAALAPAPKNSASPSAACGGAPPAGSPTATVGVGIDLQPEISISLDRTSVAFGSVLPGGMPAPVPVTATVLSNDAAGYSLTVHRSVFTPADLPLAISHGGPLAAIPVAPAPDLALVSTTAASVPSGDVVATTLGFATALPLLTSAHYAATVTYTVIGK